LGYVEQLYTFGNRDRAEAADPGAGHALSIAYLALVREARPAGLAMRPSGIGTAIFRGKTGARAAHRRSRSSSPP
jgi:ADP-ribose pyrophosphatase YjhB (NUDIX family)